MAEAKAVVSMDSSSGQERVSPDRQVSFLYEAGETTRRLMQHIIFVGLFSLKLYALPLIYLCDLLSKPQDSNKVPWTLLGRSPTVLRCGEPARVASRSLLRGLFGSCRSTVLAPLRVVRSLYNIGLASEQHPEATEKLLKSCKTQKPRKKGKVEGSYQKVVLVDTTSDSGSDLDEPQPNASMVYHAALLNGGTLDNILAAFEPAGNNVESQPDFKCASPSTTQEQLYRYHNPRIQATPPHMRSPSKTPGNGHNDVIPNIGLLRNAAAFEGGLRSIDVKNNEDLKQQTYQREMPTDQLSRRSSSLASTLSENTKQLRTLQKSERIHQCTTFQNRQSRSRLPRRSVDEDQHKRPLRTPLSEGNISTMFSQTGSASKKPNLKRRLRKA